MKQSRRLLRQREVVVEPLSEFRVKCQKTTRSNREVRESAFHGLQPRKARGIAVPGLDRPAVPAAFEAGELLLCGRLHHRGERREPNLGAARQAARAESASVALR